MDSNIYNPSIPFIGPLPGSLQSGNLIKISGTVPSGASCFSINLQNGSNGIQRNDIALHLSPVFSSPPRVVRNSLENQNWGPEESHGPPFPFSSCQSFEIFILVEPDHFKIAVNGQHFTEFNYRLPLEKISHIGIDGDVTISSIIFEGLARQTMASRPVESVGKPLGFVIDPSGPPNYGPPTVGRPSSPYASPSLPYPPNPSFGPSPTSPYAPPNSGGLYPSAYDSQGGYNPYAPASGRVSPSPYGPPPGSNPYPSSGYPSSPGGYPSSPSHGYPSNPQGYPSNPQGYPSNPSHGYPSNPQGYPSNPYPSQPGPYPGTSVVYPGQEKKSDGGGLLGPLTAAGAAALAGAAGSALLGGKHKKKKNKHGFGGHGMGPAGLLSGVGSLVSGNKHGHSSSSPIPMGGALAGGAAGLAGAYMVGKVLKPKKIFKHKHKKGWGGWSSSSSSSDEE
ncbi:galectin-4 isoform X2 [Parasteatoda tepidariorum]|uniref:galectin-4 isoform X2 n=1 Tax=Parasteatoda tepidariorum TaxID=114398 RepID=UPI001C71BD44|nr:galectin-3 isoform X1 [Parasteatoda tepidariorum]